jgi:hypothetical protein
MVAEIFLPARAVEAGAVGAAEPRNADSVAYSQIVRVRAKRDDAADHLVPGNDRKRPMNIAVDDVQVGPADSARRDFDQQVRSRGIRKRAFDLPQWLPGAIELHCAHCCKSPNRRVDVTERSAARALRMETCAGDSRLIRETEDARMNIVSKIIAATALTAVAAPVSAPATAAVRHHHHRHHYYGRTYYRHRVCRRSPATTGTVVGGVAGAVVGHSLLGHGLLGTAAGAVGGAVAGGAVDRSMTARYRCYYVR